MVVVVVVVVGCLFVFVCFCLLPQNRQGVFGGWEWKSDNDNATTCKREEGTYQTKSYCKMNNDNSIFLKTMRCEEEKKKFYEEKREFFFFFFPTFF